MAFNIKGIFGKEEPEDGNYEDDENYTEGETAGPVFNSEKTFILLEPRAYSESQQIADYLKKKSPVIVNLKRVTPDQAKRIVDFLSGTIYAIEGDLQKLGGGIFLCAPHGVNIEGRITSDENGKGQTKGGSKSKEEEDDEFNF